MSFWQRFSRSIDRFLGGGQQTPVLESAKVETAIRLIQRTIDDQQYERRVQRVRVSDLDVARQEKLARELRQLLAEGEAK